MPILVACTSLVVALSAIGAALFAIQQADAAGRRAEVALSAQGVDTNGQAVPTAPNTSAKPPSDQPSDTLPTPAATPLDVLNPQATYRQLYADQVLNPQATTTNLYVDLDEPRVASTDERVDIYIRLDGTIPVISFDGGVAAALAEGLTLQPKDCAELIRTSPLPSSSRVPAQRGVALCIATSPTAARQQGIKQRMVVLRVTELNSTGKATVSVNAWEIPDS